MMMSTSRTERGRVVNTVGEREREKEKKQPHTDHEE